MFNRFSLYFTKNITYINFCMSFTALTFQVGVLKQLHKYLDNNFDNINKKCDNMSIKIDNISTKINSKYDGTYNDKIDNITNKNNSIYYKNDKKISYKEY